MIQKRLGQKAMTSEKSFRKSVSIRFPTGYKENMQRYPNGNVDAMFAVESNMILDCWILTVLVCIIGKGGERLYVFIYLTSTTILFLL